MELFDDSSELGQETDISGWDDLNRSLTARSADAAEILWKDAAGSDETGVAGSLISWIFLELLTILCVNMPGKVESE